MSLNLNLINMGLEDVNPIVCGYEECEKLHSHGPAVREYYLIHYIVKGYGIFECRGKRYELKEGQFFLIYPHEVTYYKASDNQPWTYIWIGFSGRLPEQFFKQVGLSPDLPVFNLPSAELIFKNMIETKNSNNSELLLTACLYSFFCELLGSIKDNNTVAGNYSKRAIDYINANYIVYITIGEIAQVLGLDRRYFCRIFKSETGFTPQEYLINLRMEKAKGLLLNKPYSVADIARSVGYEDMYNFSKMFKKHYGVSPLNFRMNNL